MTAKYLITTFVLLNVAAVVVDCNEMNGVSDEDMYSKSIDTKGPYKVYRIYPNNTHQLDFMKTIWKSASKLQLNFWKDPSHIGVATDVMVPPEMQQTMESILSSNDIDFMITIQDVQKLIIERERQEDRWHKDILADDLPTGNRGTIPSFDFRRYHSYEEMRIYMRSLEQQFPTIAKVYSLGFSHENRPIEMIKIGFPVTSTTKKAIWVDAGIHAREWASHSTAIYFMHQLVTKYEKDPQITQFVRNLTWYITPSLNPDGYEYTRSSREPEVRMWRKNRSPNTDKCKDTGNCCMGVDLNRNFDFHWSESGASDNPCEEIYQGSSAFSEPESQAVRNFVYSHRYEIEAVITMHTYSQLWIHPFGHQRSIYPPDVADLKSTADKATKALEKLYGTKYKVGSGADTLYPASGGSDDWAKSKAGIKYVYLIELRPEEDVWDGFILDTNQLIPTGRETWEGVKVVVNAVLEKNNFRLVSRSRKRNSGRPRIRTAFRGRHHNRHQHGLKFIEKKRNKYIGERFHRPNFDQVLKTTSDGGIVAFVDIINSSVTTTTTTTTTTTSSTAASSTTVVEILSPIVDNLFQSSSLSLSQSSSSSSLVVPSSLTTWYPLVDQPNIVSCVDFAGEDRCKRWATNRVGICQRIPEYMNRNCAKTCHFCST